MSARRRLLFLAPFPPRRDGVHGGSRVSGELLHELAARHEVALVYLRARDEPPLDEAVRDRCSLAVEVERPEPASAAGRARRAGVRAIGMARSRPVWVSDWRVGAYERRLRETALAWPADVVHVEFHVMAQYLPALDGVTAARVLTPHDPGADAARDQWRAARGPERLARRLDLRSWEAFDRWSLGCVDAVIAFGERDRAALERRAPPGVRVLRIPFGSRLPEAPLDPVGSRPSVLFVGNFVHRPNVEAARRLARSIFPLVRARVPDARLELVGPDPRRDLAGLGDDGRGVTVTGRVPDTLPYLAAAAVVAAPLRLGGGMRVNVAEALGAGKAVVASTLALEGLDVSPGEHVLAADGDGEFAAAVASLLEDAGRRRGLAEAGRRWAEGNLSWARVADRYDELYETLLGRRGA
jgi:polysaccharide biosynthesis protein PslH